MSNRFRMTIYITLERLVVLLTPYMGEISNAEALDFIPRFNSLEADNFIWEIKLDVPQAPEEKNPHINGINRILEEYFNMHRPEDRSKESLVREIRRLRTMVAFSHCKNGLIYGDDGELSDNSERPAIDYRRDSIDTIESSLRLRADRRAYIAHKGDKP